MPFTNAEKRVLIQRAVRRLRAAGATTDLTKQQLTDSMDAVLGVIEGASYKNGVSAAIDAAAGEAVGVGTKKHIHDLALNMIVEGDYT